MADDLAVGARLWLPCEVKPGPFTDERRVLVHGEGGNWMGFVNVRWLQEKEAEGRAQCGAREGCRGGGVVVSSPNSGECAAGRAVRRET